MSAIRSAAVLERVLGTARRRIDMIGDDTRKIRRAIQEAEQRGESGDQPTRSALVAVAQRHEELAACCRRAISCGESGYRIHARQEAAFRARATELRAAAESLE